MLADCFRLIAGDLQEVGLQGPDKEAPTSRRIPRINNELSRPTEGVWFCLSGRSAPFHQQSLFESNSFQPEFPSESNIGMAHALSIQLPCGSCAGAIPRFLPLFFE